MPLCPDGPLAKRNNQKYFSILSECSRRMIEIQNVLKKSYLMINMIFFYSGGTRFNVIGEGFVAIDSLTVGIQESRVRK